MNIPEITQYARPKGLNLLGTGDALHPEWMKELKETLEPINNSGFYKLHDAPENDVSFITQVEVATMHQYKEKYRRIHHIILLPSLETADQLASQLTKYGNIRSDGRPLFMMTPAELTEITMKTDSRNLLFPAHAWTPWWSLLGTIGGVDGMEECYEDQVKHIHALETGLSSDPPMNWRVSALDKYTLLSNSDSHSPWPWRMGREANVFELPKLEYHELIDAIVQKDPNRLKMTIEVNPAYGKYHYDGHRSCGVGPLTPEESRELGGICSVCGKKLTRGVVSRLAELADRNEDYAPKSAIPFKYALPLTEILAHLYGLKGEQKLYSGVVWDEYNRLISKLGTEYQILLELPANELLKEARADVVDLILKIREGRVKVKAGYDGVYGEIQPGEVLPRERKRRGQTPLQDYV
jgi:uncharacterized protein (TIGR00375 family)